MGSSNWLWKDDIHSQKSGKSDIFYLCFYDVTAIWGRGKEVIQLRNIHFTLLINNSSLVEFSDISLLSLPSSSRLLLSETWVVGQNWATTNVIRSTLSFSPQKIDQLHLQDHPTFASFRFRPSEGSQWVWEVNSSKKMRPTSRHQTEGTLYGKI